MPYLSHRLAVRAAILALLVAALTALTATAAHAATYTVTTTNDDDPAVAADCATTAARGGPVVNPTPGCSLREAVIAANATPDDDTINVPAGTYFLTNDNAAPDGDADLDLASFTGTGSAGALRIVGAGARSTTIRSKGDDASGDLVLSRIFELDGGTTFDPGDGSCVNVPGALVELIGLRIAEGVEDDDGGGVLVNDGGSNCAGQDAPAFDARLTVRESAIERNSSGSEGGGISNYGEVSLVNSLVATNDSSDDGGGIYSEDTVTLLNTTVGGNQAGDDGGGIRAYAFSIEDGPGGDEETGLVDATNATIAFNESDGQGGGFAGSGYFGPGASLLDARNTIIANNRTLDDEGSNCFRPTSVVSGGNNLENEDTCGLSGSGDQSGTDPLLGARRDNGGPTDTYALLAGSPAIDAGTNDECPGTDQRLVARPQGARCDVGAYEFVPPPAPAGATTVPAAAAPPTSTVTNNTVLVPVAFPRLLPRSVSARVAKSRTGRRGLRLRTTGRVALPAGLTPREACTFGVITVQVKSGTRTVSTRLTELRDDCTYVSSVTFSVPSRLGRRVLSVAVRFAGNDRLQRRSAPRVSAGRP